MIKFRYTGPVATVFSDGGIGEVDPGAEFQAPDEVAVMFALHGHCECLEPDKLATLVLALPEENREGLEHLAEPAAAATPPATSKAKKSTTDDQAATAK